MTKQEQILKDIKSSVSSLDAGAKVILFGSRARGDYNEQSDWDILILTENSNVRSWREKFREVLLDVEAAYSICISLMVRNKSEWDDLSNTDIYHNIEEDGINA